MGLLLLVLEATPASGALATHPAASAPPTPTASPPYTLTPPPPPGPPAPRELICMVLNSKWSQINVYVVNKLNQGTDRIFILN